ncbi:MAG: prolyl oligopeptidase family serine peptidase [Ignavibacteria bacterium]|nr:prolyl oligopeptidase family serine peptidase [Ignavibacteria bacterium]
MILSRKDLILNETQEKLLVSGWGKSVFDKTVVKNIVYESDGIEVQGYAAYPASVSGKIPLIIWNRGGNNKDGRIDDFLAAGIFGEIASWGYLVLASNYREDEEFGGKDVNDILKLLTCAGEFEFCDINKVGMEGWSRGGMMTYIVLCLTERIKCAVIISGLADLFRSERKKNDLAEVYINLFGSESEEEFINRKRERSAVYFAEKINRETEILLIHGTNDRKISFQDSVDVYNKLKANGNNCELKLIEGGDHYLRNHKSEVSELRRKWFDRHLK